MSPVQGVDLECALKFSIVTMTSLVSSQKEQSNKAESKKAKLMEGITIQKAAEQTGVSAHTLRYYERIDLLKPVSKSSSGHRRYSEEDMHWIHFLSLLRVTGMPIEQMKAYVRLERNGPQTEAARLELLETHRNDVLEEISLLQNNLKAINQKIAVYKGEAESCFEEIHSARKRKKKRGNQ